MRGKSNEAKCISANQRTVCASCVCTVVGQGGSVSLPLQLKCVAGCLAHLILCLFSHPDWCVSTCM